MRFIENRGQWDQPGRFIARGAGLTVQVDGRGLLLQAVSSLTRRGAVVRLDFGPDGRGTEPVGEDELTGYSNFFLGNDPERWRTHVPAYGAVCCREVRPGIDLRVHGRAGRPEYDVLLAPGVDPAALVVSCEGLEGLSRTDDGGLLLRTPIGPIVQPPAVTWQEDEAGLRHPLVCAYRILDEQHFTFEVADRDAACTTIIDPGLEWATYLGATSDENSPRVAITPAGNIIVAGSTSGMDFPTTPGAFDASYNGSGDAYVTSLDPTGESLVFSTYLGGSSGDGLADVAVGADGRLAVLGITGSMDFPTTSGAFDTTLGLGGDAFVTCLAAAGDALIYSTYLGGSAGNGFENPAAVTMEPDGSVVIVGETEAPDFPVTPGAFDTTLANRDAFVTRLSADGSSLIASTLLGGHSPDYTYGGTVDTDGAVFVVGLGSAGFPVTAGAFDTSPPGGYVAKLDPTLSRLEFSTILASHDLSSNGERLLDVAVDPSGAVTVAGYVGSELWPVTAGAFDTTFASIFDIFVSRLDATGSTLLWSTYLGGFGFEEDVALSLDSSGSATVVGKTNSAGTFPVTPGAFDTTWNGDFDAFVARLSPDGSKLWYGSYLGGSGEEGPVDIQTFDVALSPDGSAVAVGLTRSADFPVTPGAFDNTLNGIRDAFVAKLDMLPTGVQRYGSSTPGCAGLLAIGVASMPKVGSPFGLTCTNAPPSSSQGQLFLGVSSLAGPVLAKGAELWVSPSRPFVLIPVASSGMGGVWLQGMIPPGTAFAGVTLYAQFFWPNPCAPPGLLCSSNALAFTIQP